MIEKLNQILQGLLKNPIVDEYDTSDGWHVRKYANGRAEATKTATVSPETTGAAIGSVYMTNVRVAVPSGVFLTYERAWVATTFGNGVWAEPYRIVGGNVVFSVLRGGGAGDILGYASRRKDRGQLEIKTAEAEKGKENGKETKHQEKN